MEFDAGVIISGFVNLFILLYFLYITYSYRAYLWHKVEAVITKSDLKITYDEGDMFEPEIEYEYVYEGRRYTNNYIAVAVGSSNIKSQAEHILAMYGKGWKVLVYVNPKKPFKSILAPGIRLHHLTLLSVLIFGLFVWVPVGWNFWGYCSNQGSALYVEEMIPVKLDAPKIKKLEIAKAIREKLLINNIKAIIQKENNYITPMAMDEGFQLTVKEEYFSSDESVTAVQLVCSFEHSNSKNYPKIVTKACRRLVELELKEHKIN